MNSIVDKLDVGILVTVPVHLSKLSDLVRNDAARKIEYSELVKKFNGNKITDTINYKLTPDGFAARLKQASFASKMRLLIS